jgi:hypothetical protein
VHVDFWKATVRRQFDAALDMLNNAIHACPDAVWFAPGPHLFWYLAYHTIFWTDLYLSGQNESSFRPPSPFSLSELDEGAFPERAYSKDELSAYLQHCRKRLDIVTAGMDETWIAEPCSVPYRDMSKGELLLYNLRHVQHHAAQLNMLLRQKIDFAPPWVSKGRQKALSESSDSIAERRASGDAGAETRMPD